jgi:hypothetical protein
VTTAARIKAFAEGLRDEGIPALISYMDDDGWHLAAPACSWVEMAKGLRSLAEECERIAAESSARTLN